jgi:glycosyltransferase involved in cell wall biosynthesis
MIAQLGIGASVHLLPYAMSKSRLLRYYRAADIVADQFTVGSYGASALEAMSCARPLLIHLDRARYDGAFPEFPPVLNVSEPAEIATALERLIDDAALRARLGAASRAWIIDNHGGSLVARTLSLCEAVLSEARGPRP